MRESWTDERLDDGFDRVAADIATLRGEVGSLRKEVRSEIGGLRQEMRSEIGGLREEMHDQVGGLREEMRYEIGGLREEMHDQIGGLREDFAALQRTLLQIGGGVIVALIGVIVTQL